MRRGTFIISLIILLGMSFLLTQTYNLPKSLVPHVPGPDFLPRVYINLGIILCLILVVKTYRSQRDVTVSFPRLGMLGVGSLIMVTYIVIMKVLGYFLATFLFIGSLVKLMRGKNTSALLVSALFVVFTYIVFLRLFSLPLPMGMLF